MSSRLFISTVSIIFFSTLVLAKGEVSKVQSQYTTKYDNINLDDILNNKRLLQNYIKCLLNEGPCTADGAELKKTLPDAIETDCTKCSDTQRDGSTKVIHFLIDNEPDAWDQLEKLYDPSGDYRKRYLDRKDVKIEPITSTTEAP